MVGIDRYFFKLVQCTIERMSFFCLQDKFGNVVELKKLARNE